MQRRAEICAVDADLPEGTPQFGFAELSDGRIGYLCQNELKSASGIERYDLASNVDIGTTSRSDYRHRQHETDLPDVRLDRPRSAVASARPLPEADRGDHLPADMPTRLRPRLLRHGPPLRPGARHRPGSRIWTMLIGDRGSARTIRPGAHRGQIRRHEADCQSLYDLDEVVSRLADREQAARCANHTSATSNAAAQLCPRPVRRTPRFGESQPTARCPRRPNAGTGSSEP